MLRFGVVRGPHGVEERMSLTLTGYAILGHLALKPWTTYELAEQFRKNLRHYLPRAESQIYLVPKQLVALGLASVRTERIGRRSRSVYEITPLGEEVLRAWLQRPPDARGPALEFEAILRVMLAPLGEDDRLLAVLRGVRDDNQEMLRIAEQIGDDYVAGRAPFQRFALHRSIMHDFLCSFAELVDDWSTRSIARVQRWPSMSPDEREAEAIAIYAERPRRASAGREGRGRGTT